jgi:ABC-type branched-subunit amino acid transport system substrate-binding protein/DNA-binding beta-propeller fold protein YncE
MGVVYRAFDVSLERPVALKLIAPELAGDERFRRRFLREPKLAAALDHPNVIPIYEAGECDGQLYLAMRFVEGHDLRAELPVSPDRALDVLAQVAGALDAAHRRGLVHRDVKPANILLDADGHAYLTDFGVSKRASGDTTEPGLVGTLDYLAPEQIRGEPVDGRSDQFALACVLFECLSGAPPFRRATEGEALWAHLHDDPPPLRPALDPVLGRALAKDKDDRYATCGEMVAAARAALASGARAPRRRRFGLVAAGAGLVVLAVVAAAALSERDGGGSAPKVPAGRGVVVLGAARTGYRAFIEQAVTPSNLAVGERALWALDTDDATVTRLDPHTNAITGHFDAKSIPAAVAAGAGAVWVGNTRPSASAGANSMVSVSRIDPRTLTITHTATLPNRGHGSGVFDVGRSRIAVGDGAVWAIDPDGTVARIDPRSGRVVKTIKASAGMLAAGAEGVWVLTDNGVARIDPAKNRLGTRIPLPFGNARDIAVGSGAVWVTDDPQGLLWRIDVGRSRTARTIDVGVGAFYVSYGAGAVWVGNFVTGTVSRVDPRTNRVTARHQVGAIQSLAAGERVAWASTDGGTENRTLPAPACSPVDSGGRAPDVLIASDLPLHSPDFGASSRADVDAIRLVLQQHGYRAGRFNVGYQSCDESTVQNGTWDPRRCAANANAYARDTSLVALIGPFSSFCAEAALRTLNLADGGPLPVISPSSTDAGLTRSDGLPVAAGGNRGEPGFYYPTGVRNFVRLQAVDALEGTALAVLAKQLGLTRVYVLLQKERFYEGQATEPFQRGANALGVGLAGESTFETATADPAALADRVARSHPDGVLLGVDALPVGVPLVKALRARLGPRVPLLATGIAFDPPEPSAARGVYVASTDVPRSAVPLTAAGERFARETGEGNKPKYGVLESAQAAQLVLSAIARSDGKRASVLRNLRASRVTNGILGSFRFDRNGDADPPLMPVERLTITRRRSPIEGAVFDRLITIPEPLARP